MTERQTMDKGKPQRQESPQVMDTTPRFVPQPHRSPENCQGHVGEKNKKGRTPGPYWPTHPPSRQKAPALAGSDEQHMDTQQAHRYQRHRPMKLEYDVQPKRGFNPTQSRGDHELQSENAKCNDRTVD